MVCVVLLLLLVPGILTWEIAGGQELKGWRDLCKMAAGWLVNDLVVVCMVYAAFYVLKGAKTVSFSTRYLGEEVYYSIYDISFVFRYSVLALLAAAVLGVVERFAGKLFTRKGRGKKPDGVL